MTSFSGFFLTFKNKRVFFTNLRGAGQMTVCSHPEDGLRCRIGINPSLKLKNLNQTNETCFFVVLGPFVVRSSIRPAFARLS